MKTLAFFGFIVGFILSLVFLAATGCGGSDRGIIGKGPTCIADALLPGEPSADVCDGAMKNGLLDYSFCLFDVTKECFSDYRAVDMAVYVDPSAQVQKSEKCENKAFSCLILSTEDVDGVGDSMICKTQAECHDLIENCWRVPACL